jgi:FKBP-type peptidyl-prolyl cis-trans isomerase
VRVRTIALIGALLASLACAARTPQPADEARPDASPPPDELPRADDGVLYAIGTNLGKHVLPPYALDEAEAAEVARGLVDGAQGLPYAGVQHDELPAQVDSFHERRLQALAKREEMAGAPTLELAARAEGAVKTESGMVLSVLEPGSGASPTIFDYVRINFHGTLRDGTVFWTNRGEEPYRVQLGTTTRCWQEALGAVAPGARARAVCPPALGYGWGGWPGRVPGGAVLIYDLGLLEVIPTPAP